MGFLNIRYFRRFIKNSETKDMLRQFIVGLFLAFVFVHTSNSTSVGRVRRAIARHPKNYDEKNEECWDEGTWYNGRQAKTAENVDCVVWEDVSWARYKSFGVDENRNYCRYASSSRSDGETNEVIAKGPWCYTSTSAFAAIGGRKQSCGIKRCPRIGDDPDVEVTDEYQNKK